MAKLKCKNCETLFELNGSEDIDCPHCHKKLTNSYIEWIKKPGNEHKSFDDYKRKKCYSSHTHSSSHLNQSTVNSQSRSNPYKHIYTASKRKKRFRKRMYIIGAIVLFHVIALFTNPDLNAHKKALHEKIYGKRIIHIANASIINRDESDETSWKHEALFDALEREITVNDFLLFSVTTIAWKEKTYPIGIGLFGYVYITDKVVTMKKRI